MEKMLESRFIPVGYMYKRVAIPPSDLPLHVKTIYSAGVCGSPACSDNFADFVQYWTHNNWNLFDSPEVMERISSEIDLDLGEMTLFFYESFALEFDFVQDESEPEGEKGVWSELRSSDFSKAEVTIPSKATFVGFDVVQFVMGGGLECSLLSCSNVATQSSIPVNHACLYDKFEDAKTALESGIFHSVEPGPYRIFKIYTVERVAN